MSDIRFLGSPYGGYHIDVSRITPKSVVYDFGVGLDASFALELAGVTGCRAFLFDPTPEVASHLAEYHNSKWLVENYQEIGIGTVDGKVPFYHHKEPSFVTHSVQPGGSWERKTAIRAELHTISTIMRGLGHSKIDYLKLNLGGDYEYDVILNVLKRKVYPAQLAYIWVHMATGKKSFLAGSLAKAGYKHVSTDDHKKVDLLCR